MATRLTGIVLAIGLVMTIGACGGSSGDTSPEGVWILTAEDAERIDEVYETDRARAGKLLRELAKVSWPEIRRECRQLGRQLELVNEHMPHQANDGQMRELLAEFPRDCEAMIRTMLSAAIGARGESLVLRHYRG